MVQMGAMTRTLTHLLICLTLGLTLVISGDRVAAARLTMALEAASTTKIVICADGQVKTVVLNADGEPVSVQSQRQMREMPRVSTGDCYCRANLCGLRHPDSTIAVHGTRRFCRARFDRSPFCRATTAPCAPERFVSPCCCPVYAFV